MKTPARRGDVVLLAILTAVGFLTFAVVSTSAYYTVLGKYSTFENANEQIDSIHAQIDRRDRLGDKMVDSIHVSFFLLHQRVTKTEYGIEDLGKATKENTAEIREARRAVEALRHNK